MIVYKKCQPINDCSKRVIGIFELLEDTIILPKIYNNYSKIRINKCKLIRVEDLYGNNLNLDKIESVCFSLFDVKVIFEKDKISLINNFDESDTLLGNGTISVLYIFLIKFNEFFSLFVTKLIAEPLRP